MRDLITEIKKHTELKTVGGRYHGICPFHKEMTPSMVVDAETDKWHCFGCNRGGTLKDFKLLIKRRDDETIKV